MDQGEGVEGAERKEDPLDFALWKAREAVRGHGVGRALGPRAPRLAHRVLGHGRGAAGRGVRGPRRRDRPRLPPPRERGGADARRPRPAARPHLDAQRHGRAGARPTARRRCPSPSATSAASREVLDEVGRDALIMYFCAGHYRQPLAFSRERFEDAARARRADPRRRPAPASPATRRAALAPPPRGVLRGAGRRLQHAAGARGAVRVDPRGQQGRGRGRARPARDARRARPRQPAGAGRGPAGGGPGAGRAARRGARPAATSPRPTASGTSCRPAAGSSATGPPGPELVPAGP